MLTITNQRHKTEGRGNASFGESVKRHYIREKVKFARFMDFSPSRWIDKSTKQKNDEDSFLLILTLNVV